MPPAIRVKLVNDLFSQAALIPPMWKSIIREVLLLHAVLRGGYSLDSGFVSTNKLHLLFGCFHFITSALKELTNLCCFLIEASVRTHGHILGFAPVQRVPGFSGKVADAELWLQQSLSTAQCVTAVLEICKSGPGFSR